MKKSFKKVSVIVLMTCVVILFIALGIYSLSEYFHSENQLTLQTTNLNNENKLDSSNGGLRYLRPIIISPIFLD